MHCVLFCTSSATRPGGEVSGLGVVNTFLKDYQELHDEVDAWLVLKVFIQRFIAAFSNLMCS